MEPFGYKDCPEDMIVYIPQGSYSNYWLTELGNFKLVEYDATDIKGVSSNTRKSCVKYFSVDGRPLAVPCKGLNIIQDEDGKVRKVWIH